jgi:hypothetical protein
VIAIYSILFLWVFWYAYILVMGLYRAQLQGRLKGFIFVLALPAILVGYLMDVICNLTIASIIFFDPPKQWLVTKRLQSYIKDQPAAWRGKLALFICHNLLDFFDPTGKHC